ncbi:FAD-binding and (Fe-S)-binding domain-containing protein, partial [Nocardiopsis salina]|uniref:FAD-binding and (Fe-S)-binding domain-containing protein n=1 Tax=Nocardiopsis salina TaxID=245836 RepID=UPI00036D5AD4
MAEAETERLHRALHARLGQEVVRTDPAARAAHSSDASIYRHVPEAVVTPRDGEDVAGVLEVARQTGAPVRARGGGTSVAGNAIGPGIVVDFSARMDRVLEVDPDSRTARVQPGVVLDDLRDVALEHGLTFGPDPSTHSRCTMGGMIGNNACGSHSVAWGTTADNTVSLTHLLADGRSLTADRGGFGDAALDQRVRTWRDGHLAAFRTELGRFSRQVSGYALHRLLPEHRFDAVGALVGSESTLGLVTEATVRLVPVPRATVLLVVGFADVFAAAEAAPSLAAGGALTVEGMACDLLEALRTRPGRAHEGQDLPQGQGWLYCEFGGTTREEAREAARAALEQAAPGQAATSLLVEEPERVRALWRIRESGAGIVTRMADGGAAWPGWEDSAVPAQNLGSYLKELYALMEDHGLRGVPFGHFGEGCLHLRVDHDLGSTRGLERYRAFTTEAADLVAAHGGSLSGEHGDGRARSELLGRMYSPQVLEAFAEFKAIMDPDGLCNPGVVTDPAPLDAAVRPGPGHTELDLTPVHAFASDGGSLSTAVQRCVGVGACRDVRSGSMCPSFKATGDEVHSTRGRARVLSEMLHGQSVPGGWRSTEVRDALDLCLSCKACASECPVNVDMATYKAEFLYHHHKGRLRPVAHYSIGWLPVWSRLVTAVRPLAGVVNALLRRPRVAALAKRLGGIEPRRDMITFAGRPLRRTLGRTGRTGRGDTGAAGEATIVLWPDTFTNFHEPGVGRDAVEVLQALGHRVALPEGSVCCGLTWHSTGQLDLARAALRRALDALESRLDAGLRVVGLEPSCTVMLREAPDLLPDDRRAHLLRDRVVTLAELADEHEGPWPFADLRADAVAQVHCHQEAKGSYGADRRVLERLGIDPGVVQAGCCGLAGNFGFERGHWEVSQACAEQELYPRVRAADPDTYV